MEIIRNILVSVNQIKPFSYLKVSIDGQLQFIMFCIVGFSNTVISYVIYTLSLLLFRKLSIFVDYDYYIAQVMMFILSVAWSFFWSNRYVFKKAEDEERDLLEALVKTYVSYSFTGLFLNNILLYIWVNALDVSEFLAPIFNLSINIPVNFLLNRFWAFKSMNKRM